PVQQHAAHNSLDMSRIFAARENHFRESLAKRPVMIDLGITQVFVGQIAQALHRVFHTQLPPPHLPEHLCNFFRCQCPLPDFSSLVLSITGAMRRHEVALPTALPASADAPSSYPRFWNTLSPPGNLFFRIKGLDISDRI